MEKRVAILAGEGIVDTVVRPGMTATDVLRTAGLPEGGWLTKSDNLPFGEMEPVWDRLRDGEKLYWSARADVGRAVGVLCVSQKSLRVGQAFSHRANPPQ